MKSPNNTTVSLIVSPQQIKTGQQIRMRSYIKLECLVININLELMAGDLFNARFVDFHFNEIIFPSLGGEKMDPIMKKIELT